MRWLLSFCRTHQGISHSRLGFTLTLLALLAFPAPASMAQRGRESIAGDFDYYLLVLSWSPSYCERRDEDRDSRRAGDEDFYDDGYSGYGRYDDYGERDYRQGGRRRGRASDDLQCSGVRPYSFVLHGLWPQYERGGWPQDCRLSERPWVDDDIIDGMLDIMPSRQLVIHEYKKHGTCSGLRPRQFFNIARRAYESIRIPAHFVGLSEPMKISPHEIKRAFLDANPQLQPDAIKLSCNRGRLQDVRVCLNKDMKPRACSEGELSRRLCTSDTVTLPPVRGGGYGPRGGLSRT